MSECVVNLGNEGLFKLDTPVQFNYALYGPTIASLEKLGLKPRTMDTNVYRTIVDAEYVIVRQFKMASGSEWFWWPTNEKGDWEFLYPWEVPFCYAEHNGEPPCNCKKSEIDLLIRKHLAFIE